MLKTRILNFGKRIVPHNLRIYLRKLNWKINYHLQNLNSNSSGPGVYCPIADKSFKSFIRMQDDLLTPTNGARSRQRLVWLYLKNEIDILNKEARVLHVAPEISYQDILSKQKNLSYFPGDKMVAGYSNQGGVQNIDLTKLEFEDNSFDLVICNHVLEHIPDDKAAMSEIYRVLKPGGKGVITVPIKEDLENTYENDEITTPQDRVKHFGQWDHVRWYGMDIKKRFEDAGFEVELKKYGENFSEEDFQKYGLCNDIIIDLRKPLL